MDQVRALVAAGGLVDGDMLPSIRELAGSLEVNMMTVSKAYSKLEAEGAVARVRGRGMKVVTTVPAASLAERRSGAAVMLEPAVLQAIHLGLTDEQIQSIVQRLLREKRL